MPGDTIDIRKSGFFPGSLRVFGVLMVIQPILPYHPLVSIPFALIGLGLVTAQNGIRINRVLNQYQEYIWFLGIRVGRQVSFDKIEYLFLKENQVSQRMSSRLASTTLHTSVYDGFLRFSESDKVHLFRERTAEKVIEKLRNASTLLNVDILDYRAAKQA